jgi:beta-glucosidase
MAVWMRLSYTSFTMSGLRVAFNSDGHTNRFTVSVDVENKAPVESAEVLQVHISPRSSSIKRPLKELKGFGKK